MRILVIRHGETPSNAARIVQTPETPLSEIGARQAARLAERLAGAGIERILASDYPRAATTAQPLAEATGAPLILEPLLRERNFGVARGVAYADLGVDLFARDFAPEEGEDWTRFEARVALAWTRVGELAATMTGDLAVVTHGLVCHALARRHLLLAAGVEAPLHFANTSVTVVDGVSPWRVSTLNCAAHLEDDA